MQITETALREERIRHLLTRYPDVTPDEAREITKFVKRSSALEISLFEMNGDVKPMLTRFKRDNRDTFGMGWFQIGILAALCIVGLLLFYFMWDLGPGL